jgi:signal transduction histidine kinase
MARGDLSTVDRLRSALPRGDQLPESVWLARHRTINGLLWLHVLALPLIGLWRGQPPGHNLLDVALVAGFALAASVPGAPRVARASLTTLGLMMSSATLVHFFDGLIEVHFHFFVMIAVVSLYQSWAPYLLAVSFVLLHHGVLGTLAPAQVYNHETALERPFLFAVVHGGFVLAESIACLAYWRASEQAVAAERHERAEAESANAALAKANGEVSDLVGMLSHDLRTPLAVINGFASVLHERWEDLPDSKRDDLLARITVAGKSLQSMLDDALSVTALDAQGLQPEPQAVRLDEAVRDVLRILADPLPDPDLAGLRPVTAQVDPGHLHQMLSNLVTNAAKYGAPPFHVVTDAAGDRVTVTVVDSGEGVPPDFVERLFERFARADSHRGGDHKGTGLGLYIARRLAIANGGELRHRRPPVGHGAAFTVDLPAAVVPVLPPTDVEPAVLPRTG